MVTRLANVGEQGAMAVIDERVLIHLVGGKAADRRQRTNRLRRDRGDAEQRQEDDDDQAENDDAAKVTATPLAPAGEVTLTAPTGG